MLLTKTTAAQWPLQLSGMPAIESDSSSATPFGVVGTTLLKRHKILPHPQRQRADVTSPHDSPSGLQKLTLDSNLSSSPDSSSSRTLKHSTKRLRAPSLPLTPPTHSRQSSAGYASFTSAIEDILPAAPSVPGTPPNQRSPPTPDVTPPKAAWRTAALRPLVSERYPSSRADSFTTAKETQTPNQSDEDEFFKLRPPLPSSVPSSQETVHWAPIQKPNKPIGLGLGLESDNDGSITPKPTREFISFDGEWGSGTGDISEVEPEWDDNLMRNVTVRKRPVVEAFNDSPCPPGPRVEVYGDNCEVEPSNATKQLRKFNLQEKIAKAKIERDENRMKEKSGIRSISPAVVRDPDIALSDARRFSTLSGRSQASTIVEAMVVEAPTPRPNALRRTKKRSALREISTPGSPLRQQSSSPGDLPRRLVHKNSRIPDRRQASLGSTGTGRTVSTTSSSGKSRKDVLKSGAIPVVVVPERTSSSKSVKTPSLRSTSSRHTKGSRSISASSTAPPLSALTFDLNLRRRALSESSGSRQASTDVGIRSFDIEPIVPIRTSSLSATTSSKNESRTGSLTAESLRAHNASLAPLFPPKLLLQSQKQPRDLAQISSPAVLSENSQPGRRKSLDQNGDPFFGTRLSTQVTPFSQISYGTSGTAGEVAEALAVSLFQHHNDSLLMVQQQPANPVVSQKGKQVTVQKAPKELLHQGSNAVIETVGRPEMRINDKPTSAPVTPPQPSQPLSMADVDSPLRNPRQAPEPPQDQVPAIKFIPPTPASTEDDRQLGQSLDLMQEEMPPIEEMEDKPKRGLSLVRRALSKRRYSEGFLVGLGRRFSTKDRGEDCEETPPGTSRSNADVDPLYPASDIPSDASKLHPFWRPARFWDDLENEQQSDYGDDGLREYGNVLYENGTHPSVETRPTMPKRKFSMKRTFAILPIKDDHEHLRSGNETDRRTMRRSPSGNLRVVKRTASNSSLRRSMSDQSAERSLSRNRVGRPATSDGFGADGNGRVHTIPGIGIRFEYVGFRGLQARMRERKD